MHPYVGRYRTQLRLLWQSYEIIKKGYYKVEQQVSYFNTMTIACLISLLQITFLTYTAATQWNPDYTFFKQPNIHKFHVHAIYIVSLVTAYAFTMYTVQRHRELRKDVGLTRHVVVGLYLLFDIVLRWLCRGLRIQFPIPM